ncbi:MAG: ribosomal protein S18-alanine N-acetyltransferase [Senegalia sp. (in: firmicutes)]|uniref:ribosomal protein S18-alanine N-acetyltransferase n=1 Tax=Senegalia sp. (in: firmicutes) TaxID=1924098 RepID=UPI003F9A106A
MKRLIKKMNDIIIREMNEDDIDDVLEVEKVSFSTPWSKESFIQEIKENKLARYIIAQVDEKVVAYGGMWLILDEAHITNVAVATGFRNRGIGQMIIDGLTNICNELIINHMTLEVRKSNYPAIKLYKNNGFIEIGTRAGYYADTKEDAIIMWKEI